MTGERTLTANRKMRAGGYSVLGQRSREVLREEVAYMRSMLILRLRRYYSGQ